MKSFPLFLLAAALTAAGAAFGSADDRAPTSLRGGTPPSEQSLLETFDLEFPGGEFGALLRQIEGLKLSRFNVIATDAARAAELPAFKLSNINVDQLFRAFDMGVAEPRLLANQMEPGYWIVGLREQPPAKRAPTRMGGSTKRSSEPRRRHAVAQIGHLLDAYSIHDITTAIQIGWEFGDDLPIGEMKFHQETGLLLAYGTEERLRIIIEVISSLEEAQTRKAQEAAGKKRVSETLPRR